MNYKWHYDRLIKSRKDRIPDLLIYYENHHIIPKSMGGTNDRENIIRLTAREHFIAHWLLWRIHKNRQMGFAFSKMCQYTEDQQRLKILSSRQYAEIKEALSFSFSSIDHSGEHNSMWGKKHSEKTLKLLKEKAKNRGIGETNSRSRPVYQYNSAGELIRKWKYAKECVDFYEEKKIHISRGNISSTAKFNTYKTCNILKSVKGFIFSFDIIEKEVFEKWKTGCFTRYWKRNIKEKL